VSRGEVMTKSAVLRAIAEIGVVPVVRAQSPAEALEVIEAIRAGGVRVLEVTMTVPGAIAVIEAIATQPDVLVGAGTVLDPETARACVNAGARFIVSPALNLETIAVCRHLDVAIMPGALTPTEIVTARNAGADVVKVFPCGAVGGAGYIKSLKAPLPDIALMPTGGISLKNVGEFIRAGAFAVGVGADLVDVEAIRRGEAAVVTDRARAFVQLIQEARGSALM
jgi:2-dehydro-3-deoxyphosphogluconate aldolase/(4S)-4-hydroxy-2-oxoglutarate aldolase